MRKYIAAKRIGRSRKFRPELDWEAASMSGSVEVEKATDHVSGPDRVEQAHPMGGHAGAGVAATG
jgi:hypothetical protein